MEGVRGPGGGYRLAKPAGEITIARVIAAVDENVDITRCQGKENCQEGARCLTHELWSDLSNQLFDFLNGITLQQFKDRPDVKAIAQRQDKLSHRNLFTSYRKSAA